jgi:hypothetical protein
VAGLSIYTTNTAGIEKINADNNMMLGLYPNPAKNSTTVTVKLSKPEQVSVELYDIQGNLVKSVAKERAPEGLNQYSVSLADMSAGVYYVRLITETTTCGKKLVVTK